MTCGIDHGWRDPLKVQMWEVRRMADEKANHKSARIEQVIEERNVVGIVGELVFAEAFGLKADLRWLHGDDGYDNQIYYEEGRAYRIDVKSSKTAGHLLVPGQYWSEGNQVGGGRMGRFLQVDYSNVDIFVLVRLIADRRQWHGYCVGWMWRDVVCGIEPQPARVGDFENFEMAAARLFEMADLYELVGVVPPMEMMWRCARPPKGDGSENHQTDSREYQAAGSG